MSLAIQFPSKTLKVSVKQIFVPNEEVFMMATKLICFDEATPKKGSM